MMQRDVMNLSSFVGAVFFLMIFIPSFWLLVFSTVLECYIKSVPRARDIEPHLFRL